MICIIFAESSDFCECYIFKFIRLMQNRAFVIHFLHTEQNSFNLNITSKLYKTHYTKNKLGNVCIQYMK